jgi:hypothetical protein
MQNDNELLGNELLFQIPTDPQKEEIIEILAKAPAAISYEQNLLADFKNQIAMKKLLVKKYDKELERMQSIIKMQKIRDYQRKLEAALLAEPEKIKLFMTMGYDRVGAKERVKLDRPDKPTATDLKDIAIIETKGFYEENIHPLEEEINFAENNYEKEKVKYNLFENNFRASQSIKGLIQQDANNHHQ